MEASFNICPLCETEYHSDATACADCHTPLVSKAAYARAFEPLPFSDDLVEIRTETIRWIKQLAEALAKAGIRCHVRFDQAYHGDLTGAGNAMYYHTLYVHPEHEKAARYLDSVLLGDARLQDVEAKAHTCPACGAPCPADAQECPACGLFLGSP